MSRFTEGDDDYELAQLDRGRWERNARAVLKSKRGRRALAEIREALLALPEPRLIEGALCTVGGVARVREVTEAEVGGHVADLKSKGFWRDEDSSYERAAEVMRYDREDERDALADSVSLQGVGVCVNGALLWHRLVKGGMTPGVAFATLPTVITAGDGDPMSETARITEKEAGIAYTLAYELAYRNDETYGGKTPEGRYAAFLAWIDAEFGETAGEPS